MCCVLTGIINISNSRFQLYIVSTNITYLSGWLCHILSCSLHSHITLAWKTFSLSTCRLELPQCWLWFQKLLYSVHCMLLSLILLSLSLTQAMMSTSQQVIYVYSTAWAHTLKCGRSVDPLNPCFLPWHPRSMGHENGSTTSAVGEARGVLPDQRGYSIIRLWAKRVRNLTNGFHCPWT